jgi:outer membrane protein OmpA-like peptidoglycan-associated protein
MQRAVEEYDKFHYAEAAKMFETLMAKEGANLDAKEKLAMCYRKMNDSKNAEKWFALVVNESADPMNKLYYAQVLAQNQKYAESREWYEKFAIAMKSDKRGKDFANSYADVDKYFKDVERYTVELAPFNSKDADFSPAYYRGGIVFCSNRPRDDKKNKLVHKWTGKRFLDLYYAPGAGPKAKPFSDNLNTQYHEGSSAFYNDGASIIFTRNNYNAGKFGKSTDDVNKLKLFLAQQGSGDWVNVTEFPFNDAEYSIAHPAISPDGQTLYFTSDMPGSLGETDIWMCKGTAGGGWGAPINLGKEVNTKGKEAFPFIDAQGNLFFSSDGHAGLGGMDIFVTRAEKGKNKYSVPQNIGAPINSNKDDFSLIFDQTENEGYFSSNRDGGVGDDDIYKFSVKTCEVQVMIVDAITGKGIPDAKLSVLDKRNQNEIAFTQENDSTYLISSFISSGYNIKATKEKYSDGKSEITEQFLAKCKQTGGRLTDTVKIRMYPSGSTPMDPDLAKLLGRDPKNPFGRDGNGVPLLTSPNKPKRPYTFGGSSNVKLVDVVTIYYDLDKYNIRPDASKDLERVLRVLYEYPNMVISMSSHTDSRDTFEYNVQLAKNRANSAMNYLISRGIDPKRLEISSFGEIKLVTDCPDGVDCSEPDHQLNRRTEIAILSIGE